jgi:hypothetical protein
VTLERQIFRVKFQSQMIDTLCTYAVALAGSDFNSLQKSDFTLHLSGSSLFG